MYLGEFSCRWRRLHGRLWRRKSWDWMCMLQQLPAHLGRRSMMCELLCRETIALKPLLLFDIISTRIYAGIFVIAFSFTCWIRHRREWQRLWPFECYSNSLLELRSLSALQQQSDVAALVAMEESRERFREQHSIRHKADDMPIASSARDVSCVDERSEQSDSSRQTVHRVTNWFPQLLPSWEH